MPAPYSDDLRQKAIAAVKRGEKKIAVCRLLKMSRNTLDLWLKKEKATGNFCPIIPTEKGPKPKTKTSRSFESLS
jgi:transposase-like protein